MNMNMLMQQAQKMQKEMQKKQAELEAKLFEISSSGGAVKIFIYGSRKVERVEIDKDAIDPNDKEMLEDMVRIAINEAMEKIDKENAKITNSMTQGMRMPF